MAERKVKVTNPGTGKLVDGIEMDVDEAVERWSEFTFPDGTVMRVKFNLAAVTRVEGEYDNEGNPVYVTKMSPVMVLAKVPDNLKKKG